MLARRLTEFTLDGSSLAFLSGANRQQAKMTFQFACRKLQRSKDLEPAGQTKLACPVRLPYTLMGSIFKKKEGIALITRYTDNRYETRLSQPIRAALPFNETRNLMV